MTEPALSGEFGTLMGWADKVRKLGVRANADTPADARVAVKFGAEGIGLCRTEHMFFDEDAHPGGARDDPRRRRESAARGDRQAPADAARRFRRAVRDHEGAAGHDPAARSAAARVPAAWRRGDRRGRRAPWAPIRRSSQHRAQGAARVQPDARLPRLPHRHRLSRNRRDAGARDLRGRGRGRQAHRQAGGAGGDGAADRHQGRARPRQGAHRRDGGGGDEGDRRQAQLSGRHHDRAAARGADGRRDRARARSSSRSAPTT